MPGTRKKAARKKPPAAGGRSAAGVGKKLVIVESPAKAKTINKYLGPGYVVRASMGHVRDLPSRNPKGSKAPIPGVDLDNDFAPTYEALPGRKKVLAELKKYAKSAPEIFLATDLDREGEAIAWHLAEGLNLPAKKVRRVIFNEITASAIREAFAHPRQIDMNKVNAQQARRILDRIVGYQVSPLLWRKIARGLSAGRVQSVAVRLVVDREREIDAFTPEEFWRVGAVFTPDLAAAGQIAQDWQAFRAKLDEKGNGPTQAALQARLAELGGFRAELVKWRGENFQADNVEAAAEVAGALGLAIDAIDRTEDPAGKGPAAHRAAIRCHLGDAAPPFVVRALSQRETRSRPPAPFTTATLQQAASSQMRFSASRTMRTAQQLYEGVDVPGEGSVGLITYMRTDSTHLSAEAIRQVRSQIQESFGQAYLPDRPNTFASRERAQEAHEAVRPTDARRAPEQLAGALTPEQLKLYSLIWKRFVACQMRPAVWNVTEAEIVAETPAGEAIFKATGRQLTFDGFYRAAGVPKNGQQILPALEQGRPVGPIEIEPTQRFTQPPPRYNEASLVKAMEAEGIGRPSTYAAIIQTIQDREYVKQTNRVFGATELGIVVTDKLVKFFPKILDVRFTAHMEDELDHVEEARVEWVSVLREFYGPFRENLERAAEEMVHAKAETQPSDYTCQRCHKPMVYRWSKNGRYLACTGYPDCKETMPIDDDGKPVQRQVMDVACPKCESPMLLRQGRFGPFLSCPRYPDCDGVVNLDKKGHIKLPAAPPLAIELPCPKCDSNLYLRRGKRGPWLSCSKYPKCRGRESWTKLPKPQREKLEADLSAHEQAHPLPTIHTLGGAPVGPEHTPQPHHADEEAVSRRS